MKKMRIDLLLVDRGLAESRLKAQILVMAGQVRVNDQVVSKPSETFSPDVLVEVEPGPKYVSRGGEKLTAALSYFKIDINGKVCADVGASTGGFTDCLLQNGAKKVYAIDVGRGILHWKIRQDPRVVVMEGVNARYQEHLSEQVDLVTIDASFISLKVLIPVISKWYQESGGQAVILIKPQFEARKSEVARGKGVIRDPEVHKQVLYEIIKFVSNAGFQVMGLMRSPIKGPKGNVEFLSGLKYPAPGVSNPEEIIEHLFPETYSGGT
jgi:23S rRNA (cytidine1920-2'-O)/16S rRNA (cytidine1409-2'-O)-methyltransferase